MGGGNADRGVFVLKREEGRKLRCLRLRLANISAVRRSDRVRNSLIRERDEVAS